MPKNECSIIAFYVSRPRTSRLIKSRTGFDHMSLLDVN